MTNQEPAKRIPKSLGTDAKLLGSYTLGDAAVGLFPGVLIVLLTQVLLPDSLTLGGYAIQTLTLPLAALAIGGGALFVYLTPAYISSLDWLLTIARFHRAPDHESPDSAPTHSQIERIHQDRDVIERTDGAVIGLVQVHPPSMALATDEQWAATTDSFQDFLNTSVTFPIQIYSTTQPFPVEQYLDRYRDRLDDPDVQANPRLETLIERYIEWYERDLSARQMTIRDHYVIVPVLPEEVRFEHNSALETLGKIPVLGLFVRAWSAPSKATQRAAMIETLTERLGRVETGLREIEGCQSSRVDATEAAQVIAEYWAGDQRDYGNLDQALRTRPLVGESA